MNQEFIYLFAAIALVVMLFFAFRSVVLWYYRIHERTASLKRLEKIEMLNYIKSFKDSFPIDNGNGPKTISSSEAVKYFTNSPDDLIKSHIKAL